MLQVYRVLSLVSCLQKVMVHKYTKRPDEALSAAAFLIGVASPHHHYPSICYLSSLHLLVYIFTARRLLHLVLLCACFPGLLEVLGTSSALDLPKLPLVAPTDPTAPNINVPEQLRQVFRNLAVRSLWMVEGEVQDGEPVSHLPLSRASCLPQVYRG